MLKIFADILLLCIVIDFFCSHMVQVFKSFSDSQTSLNEFVFALKSIVGTEVFVEAVGVGKGKHDLTGFIMDQSKPNQALTVHSDLPTGKDCSSLASEDIIKFLTGDFRRSKTRSNDIFWEAVWPRLLAKGWHSEQPKDVSTTKNCLVFLMPGIKKFSRSKLTKGTHYFDSVSDVLKKVAADPVLLELEANGVDHNLTAEKNGSVADMKLNQDSPLDGYQDLPKFTIIDTSLVEGEEPFNVRELRNLPADANISFVLSHHASNMVSYSSSEEEDASDRLSDDQEDRGRVTAEVMEERVSVGSLHTMVTANGHSSNGSGEKIYLTGISGIKSKPEKRKYLSPVSKRRRLSTCSNDQSSRRSFSFSKGGGLEKEKSKTLSTSKLAAVDAGDAFQTKTIARCSTKEKPSKQKTDALNSVTSDGQNERMVMENLIEDRSFEHKSDPVAEIHSKITADDTKYAKQRAHASGRTNLNKLEAPHVGKVNRSTGATPSEDQSGMKADEAPSISNSSMARDPSEATTGGPVAQQPEPALEANSRRHGTRNRLPTARALEAVALGLLGSGKKRKGDAKNMARSRPSQRARKATRDPVPTASGGDTESSVDVQAHL
jgi:hypothetical protein